ncbi:hypothetical protein KOR42_48050 [Thalassoglobus neptunius]|uniref:Uncharacterized protein n=1 Tax=Thalassoglobus neptunius TaxID=1938619 RepID=A0A5C5VV91_9PLAN|nr:hypothetical protein [Thalassoglobus neptunius]TWT41452.1 hypothetical protein KOR42_48050 [Thalassoglobus neptunius]
MSESEESEFESIRVGDLYSELMTKSEIARHFSVGRKKVPELLKHLEPVQIGSVYRIPLRYMPLEYLRKNGLI